LKGISIVGVGGVMSGLSARRMSTAGAQVIGLATALGREGVDVFERISNEILDDLDPDSDY
jgi:dihydroorotate dehydrogenase (fumarate)